MAWRDGKASSSRLLLFMASIILGIAAVVSIQLFSENLKENIKIQSKAMMGADFVIDSRQDPTPKVKAIVDSLVPSASEVNFSSMALFPKNGESKLIKVRAIEGRFPFYGTLETEPVTAAATYQELGGALVDATLMLQYNLNKGDSIKIGKLSLPIIGTLNSIPGSTAISASVAPTVLIPYRFVNKTELLQFGSRKEYQFFFTAPSTMNLEQLSKKLNPILKSENADIDTHINESKRLGRRSENVGKFLNLAAFIALLLGSIGIASSVHIYIKEKLRHVAVLKCLGASRKQSFSIFLIQIAFIGLLGGILGTLLGIGLQQAFPLLLQEFLPFDVEIFITPQPIIMGILLGVLMSVLFALLPLLGTWYVSPLEVLRVSQQNDGKPRKARIVTLAAIIIFIYLFSYWLLNDWLFAFAFVIGVAITFSILAGSAVLFMRAVKKYFPENWGFTARQSLLNLYRPNNQTMVLILAIGLGTFLISTLYFTKDILLAKTALEKNENNPNIILLDVQPSQRDEVANAIVDNGFKVLDNISLITMRIHSIKGKLANDLRKDSILKVDKWVLNHEFRTTFRDSLIASEELVKGEWVPEIKAGEPIVVSLSEDLAERAKVDVGDNIVFNVQGVLMETTVGSLRKVDWAKMQMNFTVVFPKGVLENAPQFHVLATHVPDNESAALLQRNLVKAFPTISVIDLRQMYTVVESILDKISWVINFMAFFSILTGIIVLIGSVRTSKYQRIKESVLLRTMGAKSNQILKITALEYLYLGLLGSFIGILLSFIGSQILATVLFKEPFVPSAIPFLVFLPGITALVLLIGLSNIRSVLSSPPLEVLRKEG
ncbi:FtsX-like permease family protein [Aureibaculum marinum]|uniref:FtsX-like permease family protein n=1 Tax=Aureibaculum marinum TaxID=2487930 RepID=A0A3N4NYS4_9FLAO|nr:FtsX-like permease family protein [Aureibaculum marinum]RPD98016.1 FtsX-like permease family protein [Aureibaculum marinum]